MTKFDSVNAQMVHSRNVKPLAKKKQKFSEQVIRLSDAPVFFPSGYESFFLALYFVLLPYIAGLLFQFFYICEMKINVFVSLYEQSVFMLIWAMGYELIASTILMVIFKMSITFSQNDLGPNVQKFRIP